MRNINVAILSAADTGSHSGAAVDTGQVVSASFTAVFGDTGASGTVKIQASNDIDNANYVPGFAPTNWVDIPGASAVITSGSSAVISIAQMAYKWVRAVYTRTSGGTTSITVTMNGLSM